MRMPRHPARISHNSFDAGASFDPFTGSSYQSDSTNSTTPFEVIRSDTKMNALIRKFASLKITVCLLVLLLVALSAGTIVESRYSAADAGRYVYGATWFRALLTVFAINLTCSIIALWPWGRNRIGYVITHGSMLVILAGALTTEMLKTEGVLPIWEGEASSSVRARSGGPETILTLPFSVHLDSFEIVYYQGTHRPAQFRSRVTVMDAGAQHLRGD